MARKKQTLNPILITGVIIVGVIVVAALGIQGGWLQTDLVYPPLPMPTSTTTSQPSSSSEPVAAAPRIQPTISSITSNPDPIIANQPGNATLSITGTGFQQNCTVRLVPNMTLTTTCTPATSTTATVPAVQLRIPGPRTVYVRNPDGTQSANAQIWITNPAPTVSGINPTTRVRSNNAFNLVITGTNFTSGASGSFVRYTLPNGTQGVARQGQLVTFISPTQLNFQATTPTAGNYVVWVENPQVNGMGGGTSEQKTLTVTNN